MKNFKNVETFRKVAWVLLIIGGLNRGLLGLFNFDVVAWIFGYGFFARLIYTVVGISTAFTLLYPASKNHTPIRK